MENFDVFQLYILKDIETTLTGQAYHRKSAYHIQISFELNIFIKRQILTDRHMENLKS